MFKTFSQLKVWWQYLLPQQALSILFGYFADSTQPWLKNWLIKSFIKRYRIDMQDMLIKDPLAFPTFNSFFIRQLKPKARPITPFADAIASPVDGSIMQFGKIENGKLIQAKGDYFDLAHLLGKVAELDRVFHQGQYGTFYLAPYNYHRVHMPIDGRLLRTIYVPGKLFSVNQLTSIHLPKLYVKNERLISIFDTQIGQMAVILVGAMIVGHIQTVWAPMATPIRSKKLKDEAASTSLILRKGDELGYFKLGSTVILLFEKNKMIWNPALSLNQTIKMGEEIARCKDYHKP